MLLKNRTNESGKSFEDLCTPRQGKKEREPVVSQGRMKPKKRCCKTEGRAVPQMPNFSGGFQKKGADTVDQQGSRDPSVLR
jgi:hypothetical protein